MKLSEILLPKRPDDTDLPPHVAQHRDMLQRRIEQYADKLADPKTTTAGKEFLKSKIADDFHELKGLLSSYHSADIQIEDSAIAGEQYEVYDRQTGQRVSGPYVDARRARIARDKKDIQYGAVRYAVRPVGKKSSVTEAVHRVPITLDDFNLVKKLMERPIPAVVAPIYITDIIDDDELNDQFRFLEETEPNRDIRPLVVEWIRRVMPDQMHRFGQEVADTKQREGILSPIHGYDPKMYRSGMTQPLTGGAYGRV